MSIVPFLYKISDAILNPLILLGFAVSFVYLAYSVFKFLSSEGKEKDEAKESIIWTIVGLFIMVSVMGILGFLTTSFEINNTGVENYFNKV